MRATRRAWAALMATRVWVSHRRALSDPLAVPHEATDACADMHCYGHDRDEPGPVWRVCGECFHGYRSPGELRRRYRRESWSAHRTWRRQSKTFSGHHLPMLGGRGDVIGAEPLTWDRPEPVMVLAWRLATIRARAITFCQVCLHDW